MSKIATEMNQQLLFPETPVQRPTRMFVFEKSPLDLIEDATSLTLPVFIENQLWRMGFCGTEQQREWLIGQLTERFVARFLDAPDFALRLSMSDDPRIEAAEVIARWKREIDSPCSMQGVAEHQATQSETTGLQPPAILQHKE